MNTERTNACLVHSLRQPTDGPLNKASLKRKLAQLLGIAEATEVFHYPSPPMSSPPSPIRAPTEATTATSSAPTVPDWHLGGLLQRLDPGIETTRSTSRSDATPSLYGPPSITQPFAFPATPLPEEVGRSGTVATAQAASVATDPAPLLQNSSASSSRGGRKSKAHVASACVNCKRAHLSCDVQRPCTRCVASGKQDTCVDVAHKKRGRPRLREEAEVKAQRLFAESSAQGAMAGRHTPAPLPPPRPIAQPGHRRGESFRSIRTQASDDSPTYSAHTPLFPPGSMLQSPSRTQPPSAPFRGGQAFEVPTAFLDLDMSVLKANGPFEQIIAGSQNLRGRQLGDIVEPTDSEPLLAIRNRLRAEREAREPAYMPPILQSGHDPVQGVPEADADQVTQGFDDHTYTWMQTSAIVARQAFPARLRLAKAAGIFFIVVTLPSFRPVDNAPRPSSPTATPFAIGPSYPRPAFMYSPPRQGAAQSAPPAAQSPFMPPWSRSTQTSNIDPRMSSRTYPPPQPGTGYPPQQQQQPYPMILQPPPGVPRLSAAEPPTATTPFTPRTAARQTGQVAPTAEMQLPPFNLGSTAGPSDPRPQGGAEDEDESEDGLSSPRKRRRMNIGDVVER